jgi:hypothetical protein
MKIITKAHALRVLSRAYGPERAESLAERLPERFDLDNPADAELLFQLGLSPDHLASAMGGEI